MRTPPFRPRSVDAEAAIEYRREREQRRPPPLPSRWNSAPVEPEGAYDPPGAPIRVSEPSRDAGQTWPIPKPLPEGLLPVAPFDMAFLPKSIAQWVADISDRMQCPPDFVAIPAVVALGAVLGRKIGVRPQRRTPWTEVVNLWGCIVGRPGAMKSPAMTEALKPLQRLEADARTESEAALKLFAKEEALVKIRKEEAGKAARAAIKSGGDASSAFDIDEPEEPKAKRFIVNDTSYEALGEILSDNPNGVLAFRDELVSLLKTLDREEYAAARGFFLTAWNGTGGYTFDRIVRGRKHIDAACLSLLGGTQPARIAEYMRRAVSGGVGDDGLIQRFGLLVWPDQSPEWKEVDRFNELATTALKTGSTISEAIAVAKTGGLKFSDAVWKKYEMWNLGKNIDEIARLLTDPEAAPVFRSLAESAPGSARAAQAAARLVYITQNAAKSGDKRKERASGGRVDKRDYPAKKASKLDHHAKMARDAIGRELLPLMQVPDHVVAHALRLARQMTH